MLDDYFLPQMPKRATKTTLYHLIEAGHLARQALLLPLASHGLEAGDDAVLLAFGKNTEETETALSDLTGLPPGLLAARLNRLQDAGLLQRTAIGPELLPGARLTEAGQTLGGDLNAHWQQLDDALMGELKQRDVKKLRRILKRFSELLSL